MRRVPRMSGASPDFVLLPEGVAGIGAETTQDRGCEMQPDPAAEARVEALLLRGLA